MGKNNLELYKFAESFLGQGGRKFRSYCGMSGGPWCAAFVSYIFAEGGDASLFYGGKKVTYVPNAEAWLFANCANIPIYLALPMDVITFDWKPGTRPDHIGFARKRKSDTEILTIEGNTSGGIVAYKTRTAKYVSGCFRIQFAPSSKWTTSKPLEIDGQFGYSSIACLQKALGIKVDAILGKETVEALQKRAGVTQDGSWGTRTSIAVQKMIGVTADGWFGEKSVKALQKWINKQNEAKPKPKPLTRWDKANAWAVKIANDNRYGYVRYTDDEYTHECCICHPRGHDFGWNCIGYAFSIWRHGAGIKCNCSCDVFNNSMADRLIRMTASEALAFVKKFTGLSTVNVYRTKTYFPVKNLKQGDIVLLYDSDYTYYHTMYYMGNSKWADARSNRGIVANFTLEADMVKDIKCVIRYTGK